jgi:glycosyltransferase involved in cell wall biosynthesis
VNRWCLVVATKGRTEEVGSLLASLAQLYGVSFRTVLVDQNGDDRLRSIVDQWSHKLEIEHLKVEARGVSRARNDGLLRCCDAEFVAFPDDDCRYEPDTLIQAERAFAECSQAEILVSNWYELNAQRPSLHGKKNIRLHQLNRLTVLKQSPTYTLFFRRSAIKRAGFFDESLGPGSGTPWLCGEDADYLLRSGGLINLAWRAPSVMVSHPLVEFAGSPNKAYGYGRGRMRVLRKHAFPLWFVLASVFHPLFSSLFSLGYARKFRWHLFLGRLREWVKPFHLPNP